MRAVTDDGGAEVGPQWFRSVPPPLHVAAALAGIEALLLLGYGLTLLPAMERERFAMGVTTVVFFFLYGAALGWSAWQLRRRASWARSFVVFAQLIQLGVAWSFRGGETTLVAVMMAVTALVVLAGVFHPQSLRALEE
jgi:peptidoglycan/LPS O-acetylase OafA/YrhL